jgi:hypothetical protein
MNKFLVVEQHGDVSTIRWITNPSLEEHALPPHSFVEPVELQVGKFYYCVRRVADNFKLSEVVELQEADEDVLSYLVTEAAIKRAEGSVGMLFKRAEQLKLLKGRHNSFFKNLRSVRTWLIQKAVKTHLADVQAEYEKTGNLK